MFDGTPPPTPHTSTSHPSEPLCQIFLVYLRALEAWQWLAVVRGLPVSVWVTLVNELHC